MGRDGHGHQPELIAQLSGLEELHLGASDQAYIANIGDGVPRLRNRIEITDLGVAKLTRLERLRRLDLTRAELTPKGLAELAKLPRLESLTLAFAPRLDDNVASALEGFHSLRTLDLSGVPITDQGLAELAKLSGLRKLIVTDSEATEAGVAALRRINPGCTVIW